MREKCFKKFCSLQLHCYVANKRCVGSWDDLTRYVFSHNGIMHNHLELCWVGYSRISVGLDAWCQWKTGYSFLFISGNGQNGFEAAHLDHLSCYRLQEVKPNPSFIGHEVEYTLDNPQLITGLTLHYGVSMCNADSPIHLHIRVFEQWEEARVPMGEPTVTQGRWLYWLQTSPESVVWTTLPLDSPTFWFRTGL